MRMTEFALADDLGPEKYIEVTDPDIGLKAIVVVDNTAAGPAIGGTRMAIDVTGSECFRLARAMTLKNAMAGLAHGGAKSVIAADPRMPAAQKSRLVNGFARAIKDVRDYIPGPDMGTDETTMAQVKAAIGRAVGLPREVGGIPLDEIGATGQGLVAALQAAQPFCSLRLRDAAFVVQGFGSVGQHAARLLGELGARLVGVSDSRGARVSEAGFDIAALRAIKARGGSVIDHEDGEAIAAAELVAVPCDVWIPAARPDVITAENVASMRTKVVAQGANIPATAAAERALASNGTLVLPDFVANAGGVICASVEFHNGSEQQAVRVIEERIKRNVVEVLNRVEATGDLPRDVAVAIARARVERAMSFRFKG